MQSCKTCKYWERDHAKDAAGRIRADRVAPCLCPMPPIPDSARENWVGSSRKKENRWMCGGYGESCPTYEKRE